MKKLKLVMAAITIVFMAAVVIGCPSGDNGNGGGYVPTPPKTAEFEVSDLVIPPGPIVAGSPVTVETRVDNVGELTGTYTAVLKVDGEDAETQEVTLAGGQSKTLSFSVSLDRQGTYTIAVGDATGILEVLPIPISYAVLNLEDLPEGFQVYTLDDLGLTMDELPGQDLVLAGEPHDYFGFVYTEPMEMLLGFHMYPLSAEEQNLFDIDMDYFYTRPIKFAEMLDEDMPVKSAEILPVLSGIGDKSMGIRCHIEDEDIAIAMDVVIFRSNDFVTILLVIWMEGDEPVVTCESLVSVLEARMAAVLASQ